MLRAAFAVAGPGTEQVLGAGVHTLKSRSSRATLMLHFASVFYKVSSSDTRAGRSRSGTSLIALVRSSTFRKRE